MLTGPSLSILPRSSAMASSAVMRPAADGVPRAGSARLRIGCGLGQRSSSLFVRVRRFGRADGGDVGLDLAGRLHLLDFGAHVVERQVDRIEALLCEVRQIGFCGRARDVELRGQAREPRRARGARRESSLPAARSRLERQRLVVGLRASSSRSSSSARTSSSIRRWPSATAASSRSR